MSLFIRDDIRVRDLDRKYKRRSRYLAAMAAHERVGSLWANRFARWKIMQAVEKVLIKGA